MLKLFMYESSKLARRCAHMALTSTTQTLEVFPLPNKPFTIEQSDIEVTRFTSEICGILVDGNDQPVYQKHGCSNESIDASHHRLNSYVSGDPPLTHRHPSQIPRQALAE